MTMFRLGFMPGSYTGRTRLGYTTGSPAHGLGDTQGDAATAVELGIVDQETMDLLLAEGATDAQIVALINGQIDLPTLQNTLVQQPFASTQPGQPSQSGITLQPEPTDWASYGVEQALASLDSDISQLETWSRESSAVQTAIGAAIIGARQKYNSWQSQYQAWVNAAPQPEVLTMPDGTEQIVEPVQQAGVNVTVIVAAATVVALATAIAYYHTQTVNGLIAQAKQVMTQTGMQQQAIQQASQVAATNPTLATQILKVAQAPGGTTAPPGGPQPQSWQLWLQNNTGLVVGALVLVFVAPPLLKAISGRR